MKKALIFSPYLDSLGGGEVYTLHFAKALEIKHFKIDIAWNNWDILESANQRFGIETNNFQINPKAYQIFSKNSSIFKKYLLTSKYDVIFFLSDGSIPFLFGKKNFVHFQVPFPNLQSKLIDKIKLSNQHIICNSAFTKKIIDQNLKINSTVVYPPAHMFNSDIKENIILSVGRFTNTLQNKRQDVLIEAFKNLIDDGLRNWKLYLVGNTAELEADELLSELKAISKNYPIEFKTNVDFETLKSFYAKASIYWHASGYDINPESDPHLVEHFGLSTVEAMSAGAIPIVINKGGQTEIVMDNENGFLFNTTKELVTKTQELINLSNNQIKVLSQKAIQTAQKFRTQSFYKNIAALL